MPDSLWGGHWGLESYQAVRQAMQSAGAIAGLGTGVVEVKGDVGGGRMR